MRERTIRVQVSLTPEEKAELDAKAGKDGYGRLARWVRDTCLEDARGSVVSKEEIRRDMRKSVLEALGWYLS